MRKINAVNKNVSSSYLKDKDKVEIRNGLYDLIKGLELSDKIERLEKIKYESRLSKEFYEYKLNHDCYFDLANNFTTAFITFFITLTGVLLGFIGGVINTIAGEKGKNLPDTKYYDVISKIVNLFIKRILDIKFIEFFIFIILIIILVFSSIIYQQKKKLSYLIQKYSYQEYYANYLLLKIKNKYY